MIEPHSGLERAIAFGERALSRLASLGVPIVDGAGSLIAKRSSFTGLHPSGDVSAGGSCRLLASADGWCAINLPREDDLDLLPAWLGISIDGAVDGEVPWERIADVIVHRRGVEVAASGQELGLAVSVLPERDDEQLIERGTTNPARPWIVRRVGERSGSRSLDGLTVVDLSSLWAGPSCSRILAAAGARVIKVESSSRPDGARAGNTDFFTWLHAGKEFRSIPLETSAGREELVALLSGADVVIEGSRPRALDRMGIIPSEVVASRPGTVWSSITAYGRCGPWSNRVGFGDDAAVAGGLVDPPSDRDAMGAPSFVGDAVADPLTGLVAAALIAGAVASGGGMTIDVALREIARSAARGAEVVW